MTLPAHPPARRGGQRLELDRPWLDVSVGIAVGVFGLIESMQRLGNTTLGFPLAVLTTFALGLAVGCFRRHPGIALGLVWLIFLVQGLQGGMPLWVDLAVAFVAYGTARHGSRTVVVLSGLSIPGVVIAALGLAFVNGWVGGYRPGVELAVLGLLRGSLARTLALPALVYFLFLVLPWLVGLSQRLLSRSQQAEAAATAGQAEAEARREAAETERGYAEEIARLEGRRTQLARDVHDVVGHSLAVILSQAESAQFLTDPERLRGVLATVSDTARTSLRDVRRVLEDTGTHPVDPTRARRQGLDDVLRELGPVGERVRSRVFGQPVPLPPELETVAIRVLQEMLTNAIKHGAAATVIEVEQGWNEPFHEGELRLEVRNRTPGAAGLDDTAPTASAQTSTFTEPPAPRQGLGLGSMRARLAAVGGRLELRLEDLPGAQDDTVHEPAHQAVATQMFRCTAWLPVRDQGFTSEGGPQ